MPHLNHRARPRLYRVIRVFPSVSDKRWDLWYNDVCAEGAFRVSAQRRRGRTEKVSVAADHTGTVRPRDPFGGNPVRWNRVDVKKRGADYETVPKEGAVLTGTGKP